MNRKIFTAGALSLATVIGVAGGSLLNTVQTYAADPTPTVQSSNSNLDTQSAPPHEGKVDPTVGGHVGKSGIKEELLTGDTAEKVKAAALKAVSGGTIERVETDAEGATYEAHMKKADGSQVTVKLDGNFTVTSTENGPMGHGV